MTSGSSASFIGRLLNSVDPQSFEACHRRTLLFNVAPCLMKNWPLAFKSMPIKCCGNSCTKPSVDTRLCALMCVSGWLIKYLSRDPS